jgi:hypothetical protein
MEPSLGQIRCPVRLLWGDRDSFLSQQAPHYFIRHIRQIEGYYIEDCAHVLCLEAPYNVLQHMNAFFDLGIAFDSQLVKLLRRAFGSYPERSIKSMRVVEPLGDSPGEYRRSG